MELDHRSFIPLLIASNFTAIGIRKALVSILGGTGAVDCLDDIHIIASAKVVGNVCPEHLPANGVTRPSADSVG